jgi:protein gp37
MSATNIEWTGEVWNPIVGCSLKSPGCTNCYAMPMAARIQRMNGPESHYFGTTKTVNGKPVWTGKLVKAPERILLEPLRRKKPTTWFVNSMSDLFHEDVPDEWIDQVFAVMALCPQHTFQVLTKRSARMREYMNKQPGVGLPDRSAGEDAGDVFSRIASIKMGMLAVDKTRALNTRPQWPLPNVWLGVSCEDQTRADERIPDLLATPAAVRFVSAEPLLGPIDFREWIGTTKLAPGLSTYTGTDGFRRQDIGGQIVDGLDWIITGAESGLGRRNTEHVVDHITDIDRQCQAASVAHFVKQDSHHKPGQQGRIPDWLWARKQMPERRT